MNTSGSTNKVAVAACPFCGGTDTACGIADEEFGRFWVECICGARGPTVETLKDARPAWNKRLAPEPAGTASFNVTRYKVVQDKGEYCLKGCPDGDLVDFSAYAALLNRCNTPTKAAIRPRFCQCGIIAPPSGVKCARCEFEQPANGAESPQSRSGSPE